MKRYFSKEHEWVLVDEKNARVVRIGITHHAQESLGDITYIDMPEIGKEVTAGNEVAVLESAKVASDIYAPISGKIVEVNTAVEDNPDLINNSPYDEGWLFTITLDKQEELHALLSEEEYTAYIEE